MKLPLFKKKLNTYIKRKKVDTMMWILLLQKLHCLVDLFLCEFLLAFSKTLTKYDFQST